MEGWTPHHEQVKRAGKLHDSEMREAAARRELAAEAKRERDAAGAKRRSGLARLLNRLPRRTR